jgi:hypothetical protein
MLERLAEILEELACDVRDNSFGDEDSFDWQIFNQDMRERFLEIEQLESWAEVQELARDAT